MVLCSEKYWSVLCLPTLFWVSSIVAESFVLELSPISPLTPIIYSGKTTRTATTPLLVVLPDAETAEGAMTAEVDDDMPRINILELLSTCVDAAQRGCEAIRRIQSQREEDDDASRTGEARNFEVEYKIDGDIRSALTAADVAAQAAIVDALTSQWPCLTIVGEEDIDVREECTLAEGGGLLRKDLCYQSANSDNDEAVAAAARETAPLDTITLFVDPLDGTREFVEGRLENVQTLIGIAIDGVAVAGAVGLPFHGYTTAGDPVSSPKIVYGMVGMGRLGVVDHPGESTAASSSASRVNGDEKETTTTTTRDRLLLVAGDTNDPVLMDAYQAVSDAAGDHAGGCDRELMGGTGTKLLAIAEGRADVAVMNFKSSRWDTCATEALVRTTGGFVTDLFGDPIVHRSEIVPPDTSYLNSMGVIGSGPGARTVHQAVCQSMRRNSGALRKLLVGSGYGLTEEEAEMAAAATVETEDVRVLRALEKRREIQTQGL